MQLKIAPQKHGGETRHEYQLFLLLQAVLDTLPFLD